jgi:hypothetical protein
MAGGAGEEGGVMTTSEEYRACVEAIVGRRSEEGDYQAAALATAVAYRIDQHIAKLAGEIGREMRKIICLNGWKARKAAA